MQGIEKRRAGRIQIEGGTAACLVDSSSEVYEVRDVSRLGLCLRDCAPVEVGDSMEVHLWWPQVGAAELTAEVVRYAEDENEVGLQFNEVSPNLQALINNLEIINQLKITSSCSLVYCRSLAEGESTVASIRATGKRAIYARTPLEAIDRLGDPWTPISSVVIEPTPDALAFAGFLRDCHPSIRRVMLGGHGALCQEALATDLVHELVLAA